MPCEKKTQYPEKQNTNPPKNNPFQKQMIIRRTYPTEHILTETILLLKEQEQLEKLQCIYQREWKTL